MGWLVEAIMGAATLQRPYVPKGEEGDRLDDFEVKCPKCGTSNVVVVRSNRRLPKL